MPTQKRPDLKLVPAPPAEPVPAPVLSAEHSLQQPGRPLAILERLLERPDAARLIRQTPVQPLYLFIKALGLSDAGELLRLCSAEQVQAFLDMDAWERDRLQPDRMAPWLAALSELGPARLTAHLRKLDPEILTTLLAPHMHVYDLTQGDEPPEEPSGTFYATPDRFFLIDLLADGDFGALLHRTLESLYSTDLDLARAIVNGARWDAGAETEETAYRFRSGRMADLGYIEYYEALKVYVLVDPAKIPSAADYAASELVRSRGSDDPDAPPPVAAGMLDPQAGLWLTLLPGMSDEGGAFRRGVERLDPKERARTFEQLLLLGNQALAADRIELGDPDALRLTLSRTVGYLNIGIEYRLRALGQPLTGDKSDPAQILREAPLLYLFRLGYSLTVQLRKLASMLVQGGLVTLDPKRDPASLLPPLQARTLRQLLLVRPLYNRALDGEPVAGPVSPLPPSPDDPEPPADAGARPFLSLADLGRATAFCAELGALGKLLTVGLGLRAERDALAESLARTSPGASGVKLTDFVGTMVANLLLGRPPAFVPLPRRDLAALRTAVAAPGKARPKRSAKPAPVAVPAAPDAEPLLDRLLAQLKERIESRSLGPAEMAEIYGPRNERWLRDAVEQVLVSLSALPAQLSGAALEALPRVAGIVLG